MAELNQGRRGVSGDCVVFLIGAFLDYRHPLRSLGDLGGRRGMHEVLRYLAEHPQRGLLGYEVAGFTITQYWRTLRHLEGFVTDRDDPHLAAWRSYWNRVGRSPRTRIWHETYLVRSGEYAPVYGTLPAFARGLAPVALEAPSRQATTDRSR
jgi:hypothetical protein